MVVIWALGLIAVLPVVIAVVLIHMGSGLPSSLSTMAKSL